MVEPPGVYLRSECVDAAYNGRCAMGKKSHWSVTREAVVKELEPRDV